MCKCNPAIKATWCNKIGCEVPVMAVNWGDFNQFSVVDSLTSPRVRVELKNPIMMSDPKVKEWVDMVERILQQRMEEYIFNLAVYGKATIGSI